MVTLLTLFVSLFTYVQYVSGMYIVRMYICMCVCMYVRICMCMYVMCVCVCMHVCVILTIL